MKSNPLNLLQIFLKIFCFALTQFSQIESKCFQIYMYNLGIMVGLFYNFPKSLIVYHSTCTYMNYEITAIY